jgi:NADH-quinone oxidoreductase subunit N
MSFHIPEIMPVVPELILMLAACAVLVVDVYLPDRSKHITYQLGQVSLVLTAVACLALFPDTANVYFNGHFVLDTMSTVLKVFILLVSYFALFYCRSYFQSRGYLTGEYFILALFAVLGMMVLVSAGSLLTVYLGLELLSLCLYAMVALNRDALPSSEAAMKYFVLGALASGMLLYGMSLLYGVTGSLLLSEIHTAVSSQPGLNVVLVLALVFVVVGIAFKLGAVPFHMWVPDVYEGATTPVTLFVGSAPKIAAFGMLARLLFDGLGGMSSDWADMLAVLALLSIGVGNVIAIAQRNMKRMLAYSTISHVGFLLLGVIAANATGYAASMFYAISYAIMSAAAFGLVIYMSSKGEDADRIEDFKGLNRRNPWFAFLTLIVMLSMAGAPPFLGFWAKLSVLQALVDADGTSLAVIAVLFAVIGLYYYLRIIRLVYFDEPDETAPVDADPQLKVMLSTNALAILALGVYPSALLALCVSAFSG